MRRSVGLLKQEAGAAAHGAKAEHTAEFFGNPTSLNVNHWQARGVHNTPSDQKRVFIGSALLIGVSFVLFSLIRLTREDAPKTLSKEWQAAQKKRHHDRQMQPITDHKIGAKVTVYEPSIVEGRD